MILRLLACLTILTLFVPAARAAPASQPLAPRSGPAGATLFHRMAPAETGLVVENKYDDPRMWGDRSRGFFYGPLGTGVAIGDYDGDGRPDVAVVSKVEGHRLFRNLGNWHFEDVTARAGVTTPPDGEWEQGAAWADLNNDGRIDLYVCRSGAPNLLYMNQGDGTFREEGVARGLAVRDDSVMASVCDYDRDGWLDVYLVTNTLDVNHDDGRPDYLFHNNGDGTFTDVTLKAGIGQYPFQGHSAHWWDYDNDGWPDLYVANDFSPPDIIYHNERNGSFSLDRNSAVPHTTNSSMGGDTGDLNNDGRIDLFIADMAPTTHEKEYRTVAEARGRMNDPFLDPFDPIQLPYNALFLNTGTPFALEAAELTGLAKTDWTWSVRCEDLDCDGWVDVHFTNGMNREQTNDDLTRKIAAAESVREQLQLMKSSPVLVERNFAFRNRGDLKFDDVSAAWGLDEAGVSFGAAFGDLDGDGDLDLVYTNYQAGVSVLRNDAASGHRILFDLHGRTSNRFGVGATVQIETSTGKQVRLLSIARGYMSSSEPMLHFGLGASDHVDAVTVTWPSGIEQRLGRLDADRRYLIEEPDGPANLAVPPPPPRPQLVEISRFAGLVATADEARLEEKSVQPLLPRSFNRPGPAVAVGDLDGDGFDDICLGGTTENAPRIFLSDQQGDFRESSALATFKNPGVNQGPVFILDANGDDQNDLLLTAGGVAAPAGDRAYQPQLLINQGNGAFAAAPPGAFPNYRQPVGAVVGADFDHDGALDLFVGGRLSPGEYPVPPQSLLLRHQGNGYVDVTDALAPGLRQVGNVTSALFSDVNLDGWPDLVIATEWGRIRCFVNREGKTFDEQTGPLGFAAAGAGLWSSLTTADFNGDGRPDYVAGNLGFNTPYHPTDAEPLMLLRGKFAGLDRAVTVEGYYEGTSLFPRSSRAEMGAVFPSILARFSSSNAYARATLPNLLGEDAVSTATRLEVTQVASGVFLSQSDGTFRFAPLPRLAQIAPLQGMVAGDFDGDGFADIVALQNACVYSQNVGRFDSGLGQLMRGDGRGSFVAVPPLESGLLVPGDARALAVINFDHDAWPDFFVTRSRGPTLAWQNRGKPGRHTLLVRLHGSAGNRDCVGARVTVGFSSGSEQSAEVLAGGGVLSLSSAELAFGYPDGSRPDKITIHWPTGAVSSGPLEGTPARLSLEQPQQ